ncbi:alpha/beta hydrolase, partial [Pseudomonas aeruginosa]|nr:alpha/beta hydrolase [Pseudomonas aeruginosa]
MCSRAAEYPWVSPVARPRNDCSPEPPMSEAFNPDYLRQHLRPLAAAEADAAVLAYQAYYGLDLRSRHPRLQARLGSMA